MTTKQDEKNQKILRELLQQPENKRCADCTAKVFLFFFTYIYIFFFKKGPVYANVSLNTFVCTTCSGIQ